MSISLSSQHTVNHVASKVFDPLLEDAVCSRSDEYCRSIHCYIFSMTEQCEQRVTAENYREEVPNNRLPNLAIPAQLNAPISNTSPECIKLTHQKQRLRCRQLKKSLNA